MSPKPSLLLVASALIAAAAGLRSRSDARSYFDDLALVEPTP